MLKVNFRIEKGIRQDIYALAELETEHGVHMSFQNFLQLPESASDNDVAKAVLEWAVTTTGYDAGIVEMASNKRVPAVILEDYPKLDVKTHEALTEKVNERFPGMGLLG